MDSRSIADYFQDNAIALVGVLQFGRTASILLFLKGIRAAAFLGKCNPVVLCCKGLIQLYRGLLVKAEYLWGQQDWG